MGLCLAFASEQFMFDKSTLVFQLRHIENRLEAVAGSGVVINNEKAPGSSSRKTIYRGNTHTLSIPAN